MVGWHSIAFRTSNWFLSLFGLIHSTVGLVLIYSTVASFVNRTKVSAIKGFLEVKHRPLSSAGNTVINAEDISQLYCIEKTKKKDNNPTYEVRVVRNGKNITLLSGLNVPEQAIYVEQELEAFLGIQDRPIRGEYII